MYAGTERTNVCVDKTLNCCWNSLSQVGCFRYQRTFNPQAMYPEIKCDQQSVPTFLIFMENDSTFHSHHQKKMKSLMKRGSTPCSPRTFGNNQGYFVQTSGGIQLESYEDRGRAEDEVITDMPFARPSPLLFLRYAWPVNCVPLY